VGIFLGDALGTDRLPINFDEAKRTDEKLFARFFHALLAQGVAMAPGAYEAIFVGLGHDDVVMDDLAERFHRAALAVAL
jgi:glutamate-1-semialdehyde 2,1-aminomutase